MKMARTVPLYSNSEIELKECKGIVLVLFETEDEIIDDLFENASKYASIYLRFDEGKFYLFETGIEFRKEINKKELKYIDANYDIELSDKMVAIIEKIKPFHDDVFISHHKRKLDLKRKSFDRGETDLYYYVRENDKFRLYYSKETRQTALVHNYEKGKLYDKPIRFKSFSELQRERIS